MSAAILILITFSQLMLTPSASTLNEIINEITFLKKAVNNCKAQDGNSTEMSAGGEFVCPPKVVDTTIIKNKLHELQNNVTKLAEAVSTKNQNADDIKNRISSTEKEIEILSKLYDDIERELTQTQTQIDNILSNLLPTSNKYQNVDNMKNRISKLEKEIEKLNKLNDDKDREISSVKSNLLGISNQNQNVDDIKNTISLLEKQIEDIRKMYEDKGQEITQTLQKFHNIISDLLAKYENREEELAKLQEEEFLAAIKHRHYQLAAVKFVRMKNETSAINLISSVYEELGDLISMFEFADKVDDLKRKLLIYRTIINSTTFLHCLDCNILLTCYKFRDVSSNKVFTGELEKIFSDTFSIFILDVVLRNDRPCLSYSMRNDPEVVQIVERFCLSAKQTRSNPAIHDYSGYCYPKDSICSFLKQLV